MRCHFQTMMGYKHSSFRLGSSPSQNSVLLDSLSLGDLRPEKPFGEAQMGQKQRSPAHSHVNELTVDLPVPVRPSDARIPSQHINCHPMRNPVPEPPSEAAVGILPLQSCETTCAYCFKPQRVGAICDTAGSNAHTISFQNPIPCALGGHDANSPRVGYLVGFSPPCSEAGQVEGGAGGAKVYTHVQPPAGCPQRRHPAH